MQSIVLAVHILVAVAMIGLILIQHGKGADAGATFGAGASGTIFGAAGSGNFLTRATAVLTAIFFATSLILAVYAKEQVNNANKIVVPTTQTEQQVELLNEPEQVPPALPSPKPVTETPVQ